MPVASAKSATLCGRILRRDPQDAAALHILAMIAGRTGRHNEAIPLFRQVIALIPSYGDAHRNLGISLQAVGELTRAKACLCARS